MAKIQAGYDRIVVKQVEAETEINGFVIPESAQEKVNMGHIVSVGKSTVKDTDDNPVTYKEGALVAYTRYGGEEFNLDGESYKVILTKDILAVIED
jgi:chaperonin GroES